MFRRENVFLFMLIDNVYYSCNSSVNFEEISTQAGFELKMGEGISFI